MNTKCETCHKSAAYKESWLIEPPGDRVRLFCGFLCAFHFITKRVGQIVKNMAEEAGREIVK